MFANTITIFKSERNFKTMKKLLTLLLVAIMTLCLCACDNNSKHVEYLTLENVDSYLDVIAKVESCTTRKPLASVTSGDAEISVGVLNNSGAKFKDVELAVQVTVRGGQYHGWEFTDDNIPSELRDDESAFSYDRHDNSKKIYNIKLSYEGETDVVYEKLEFKKYMDESVFYADLEDRDLEVEIIDVKGIAETN